MKQKQKQIELSDWRTVAETRVLPRSDLGTLPRRVVLREREVDWCGREHEYSVHTETLSDNHTALHHGHYFSNPLQAMTAFRKRANKYGAEVIGTTAEQQTRTSEREARV